MDTVKDKDIAYLEQAIELAGRGLYTADPNPRVGCLIVKDATIVGQGWHHYVHAPHAEINALQEAGERAKDATAYVSLEPCAYQGRTGPCADALIEAGIRRVVIAATDPHPKVAGRGIARLKTAGIIVETDCLPAPAEHLNPGYYKRFRTGLPWVRLKIAASLDARTATSAGESQWLTGPAARADVQHWRARSSAIVTGSGTVIKDDPALTVREPRFAINHPEWPDGLRQPLRVILDRRAHLSTSARVFNSPGEALWLTSKAPAKTPASVTALTGEWQPRQVLATLAERDCNEILIEAGSELAGIFVRADLIDEYILYLAPSLLGSDGRPLLALSGLQTLAERIQLKFSDYCLIGDDLRIIATPVYKKS